MLAQAGHGVLTVRSGETYENGLGRGKDLSIAVQATVYALLMGFEAVLLGVIVALAGLVGGWIVPWL